MSAECIENLVRNDLSPGERVDELAKYARLQTEIKESAESEGQVVGNSFHKPAPKRREHRSTGVGSGAGGGRPEATTTTVAKQVSGHSVAKPASTKTRPKVGSGAGGGRPEATTTAEAKYFRKQTEIK